jgi:hypothetical protein
LFHLDAKVLLGQCDQAGLEGQFHFLPSEQLLWMTISSFNAAILRVSLLVSTTMRMPFLWGIEDCRSQRCIDVRLI